jgi:hypothetical protein
MGMTRDLFKRNETRKQPTDSDHKIRVYLMLLRDEHPLSIKVSEDDSVNARKISLPKSQIKNNYVLVEVPEWLARKVGLVRA